MKIGIPRALLYYHYFPLWECFWGHLGLEVITSPPTDKSVLDRGVIAAAPETCLPVKVYYGHVLALAKAVDYLFVPRIISAQKGTYICPKFMGLPNMIKHSGYDLPPLISPTLDTNRGKKSWQRAHIQAAQGLGYNKKKALSAWRYANYRLRLYREKLQQKRTPLEFLNHDHSLPRSFTSPTILLLGHPYNLFDEFTNMNLIRQLYQYGYQIITPEMLSPVIIEREATQLPKHLFWSLGRTILGTAFHCLKNSPVVGVIHLTSFGCGPDSLVGELLERRVNKLSNLPFLLLTLDEHTGEGGLITRLEAFLDMIEWRRSS